ncbi:MAG: sigma-70 family RNA polymerase sigma factor [Planctomycetes bacterium]|nr:sigma-70 family RNA polymerase sigma factor [Planctomycetota bacterium]
MTTGQRDTNAASDERLTRLARIVGEHQAGIWRYLRLLGCTPTEAEDATQETFLALVRGAFEERSFAETHQYLRTVARRIFMASRKSRFADTLPLDAIDEAWATSRDHDGGNERIEALRMCFEQLDAREREALRLQYESEASRAQIGSALDLSDGGVKNMLQRAKEWLKRCVERRLGA